jgi:hypothetical protein
VNSDKELPESVRSVISEHERWTFGSIASSPHDDDFVRDLAEAIDGLRQAAALEPPLTVQERKIIQAIRAGEDPRSCEDEHECGGLTHHCFELWADGKLRVLWKQPDDPLAPPDRHPATGQ